MAKSSVLVSMPQLVDLALNSPEVCIFIHICLIDSADMKNNCCYLLNNFWVIFNTYFQMGIINFNVLHALLHVFVQQADMTGCTVEFRGQSGEKLQNLLSSLKPAQAVTLSEYTVSRDKDTKKKRKIFFRILIIILLLICGNWM